MTSNKSYPGESDIAEMKLGDRVLVRIEGENPPLWHKGTCVRLRKRWIELDENDPEHGFIVDESNAAGILPIDSPLPPGGILATDYYDQREGR